MGDEARATVIVGRKRVKARVLLESDHVMVRGDELRLRIPFGEITSVADARGVLTLQRADGRVAIALGERATKWAEMIRNPKALIDKLGIKPEHRVVVLGVQDEAFRAQLAARAPDVSTRLRGDADVVMLGAESPGALDRLAELRGSIKQDGMIWAVTPKGKGGLKESDVMAKGKAAGLVDVKVAAFSATHTATKFVIPKAQRQGGGSR